MENKDQARGQSILSELTEVFVAPKRAMAGAIGNPRIIAWMVILAIMAMLIYIPQRSMFLKMTINAVENSGETFTSEEVDMIIGGGANAAMFMSMFYFVVTPLFKGFVAYALSTLLGGAGGFRSTMGVVLRAYQIMVAGQVLRMFVVLATGNPYFSFSPAIFLPEAQLSTSVFAVLSAMDIFAIWYLAVSLYGVKRANGLTTVKAAIAVFAPWLMMLGMGLVGGAV